MNAIGNVLLSSPTVLAPMAGVTDLPFRLLAKEMGCGLVYSEMVSAKGLLYENCRTWDLLRINPRERPTAVQLFGSVPGELAAAAKKVAAAGADIIDLNMGCPTPKIVKNGDGAALLRTPDKAYDIMRAVVDAVDVPVTVKIRIGWDASSINAVQVAELAEKAGVKAVAVHGRTRAQFYGGQADWSVIADVKKSVSIPVIGNGDVRQASDAMRMMAETGCDAVMVGRGAYGNIWIFRQITEFAAHGTVTYQPTWEDKKETMLRHLDMLLELKGLHTGIREMRRHAAQYIKGVPRAAEMRGQFNEALTRDDFASILEAMEEGKTA